MSDPFIGEIQLFGFNFAPRMWASCQGQLMPISQNTALYSLLGTQFGGDGRTTFALPDLQGKAACGQGQGPGLSNRQVGQAFGEATVTLTENTMPAHSHAAVIYNQTDTAKKHDTPAFGDALTLPGKAGPFTGNDAVDTGFANGTVGPAGNSQPHSNVQPYLALNFCIALTGIFPSRP